MLKISEKIKHEIIELLREGLSVYEIEGLYDVKSSFIYRIGHKAGIEFKKSNRITEETKKEAMELVKSGVPVRKISQKLKVSEDWINKIRRKEGIKKPRSLKGKISYTLEQKKELLRLFFEEGLKAKAAAGVTDISYATAIEYIRTEKRRREKEPVKKEVEIPENIGYLEKGLKGYTIEHLLEIQNMARANVFLDKEPLMKIGKELYFVSIVIESIEKEIERRSI